MRMVDASSGERSKPRADQSSCHDTGALARNEQSSSSWAAAGDSARNASVANPQATRIGVGKASSPARSS
jgi:hypothetical protein